MTQQPHPVEPELKLAREYGALQGTLDGQREALSRTYAIAYLEAHHAEMKTAGLCTCPDPVTEAEPLITTKPAPDPLADLNDILTSFLSELSRISGMLQDTPARVELVHVAAPPELKAEVDTILAGIAGRIRVPDYLLRDSQPSEMAIAEAGRLVDADDTSTAPEQHALGETAQDRKPLVTCKASDPWRPGYFCRRPLGHSGTVCDYVPVDQPPDSTDDEAENNALLNAEADQRDQTPEAENRCAYCSEAIALVGGTWYHDEPPAGRVRGHEATPANLASA